MNAISPQLRTFGIQKTFTQVDTGGTGALKLIQALIIPSYYIQILKIEMVTSIRNPSGINNSVHVALIRSNQVSFGFINISTTGIYAAHTAAPNVGGGPVITQAMESVNSFDPGELILSQQDPLSIYGASGPDANTFVSMSCLVWYQLVSTS